MFISSLTERGATPAIVSTLSFNEARLKMIAENIANINTPGYRVKQLDTKAFQGALGMALEARRRNPKARFDVSVRGEVQTDGRGGLRITPREKPVENVLFHVGTNMSIERQMADLAETGMSHTLLTTLLRGRFDGIRKAIRGTV